MKQKISATLSSATTSTLISPAITPGTENGLLPGQSAIVDIYAPTGAFNGTAKIQVSDDGAQWTDAAGTTFTTTAGGFLTATVTLKLYLRLYCTAFTSGSVAARVLSDV